MSQPALKGCQLSVNLETITAVEVCIKNIVGKHAFGYVPVICLQGACYAVRHKATCNAHILWAGYI